MKRNSNNRAAKILAIETSTSACSVALRHDGEICLLSELGNNVHSKKVLPQIETLLNDAGWQTADLDAVAIGHGPGSFTGLRIGVGVAQGISYGARCPMIGISSLAALALAAEQDGRIAAGIDARMGEIYYAQFNKQGRELELIGQEIVCAPQDLAFKGAEVLCGNAWSEYWAELSQELKAALPCPQASYPRAAEVLLLAEQGYYSERDKDASDKGSSMREKGFDVGAKTKSVDPRHFAPVYVRNEVAKKIGDR